MSTSDKILKNFKASLRYEMQLSLLRYVTKEALILWESNSSRSSSTSSSSSSKGSTPNEFAGHYKIHFTEMLNNTGMSYVNPAKQMANFPEIDAGSFISQLNKEFSPVLDIVLTHTLPCTLVFPETKEPVYIREEPQNDYERRREASEIAFKNQFMDNLFMCMDIPNEITINYDRIPFPSGIGSREEFCSRLMNTYRNMSFFDYVVHQAALNADSPSSSGSTSPVGAYSQENNKTQPDLQTSSPYVKHSIQALSTNNSDYANLVAHDHPEQLRSSSYTNLREEETSVCPPPSSFSSSYARSSSSDQCAEQEHSEHHSSSFYTKYPSNSSSSSTNDSHFHTLYGQLPSMDKETYLNYLKNKFYPSSLLPSSTQPLRSVNNASTFAATYDYDPYGKLIATTGVPSLCPVQFSSEVFDRETDLTYYNYRYYNPTDGRWLSRDPAEESASLNLYTFVNNSPNYRTDHLGLLCLAFDISNDAALAQSRSLQSFLTLKCKEGERTRICSEETISWLGVTQKITRSEYRTKEPNPNYTPTANGCGPEGGKAINFVLVLAKIYHGYDFTEACNNHDICYGTCGKLREGCDARFLLDMYSYCAQKSLDSFNFVNASAISSIQPMYILSDCMKYANIYFSAVSLAGNDAYQTAQDQACIWKSCHCSGK